MPIITFLQDIFSVAKGPYHRKIGRHTQRFCSKAAKRSTNEMQKRTFFMVAICADEFIAALIGVDNKRQVEPFKELTLKQKISKQEITAALRTYLSAILILISSHKEILLQQTYMQEQELLHTWCDIFEYLPSDMQTFNEVLLPAYQQGGIEDLSVLVGKNIREYLFVGNGVLGLSQREALQNIMVEDTVAVVRFLETKKVKVV